VTVKVNSNSRLVVLDVGGGKSDVEWFCRC